MQSRDPVRTVVVFLICVGCGFPQPKDIGGDGGGSGSDAGIDAAIDAAIDAPDAPPAQCDVFAQTGCSGSEKCTWIKDSDNPLTFHIGCAPNGSVADKSACAFNGSGEDNCRGGSFCFSGTCATICNPSNAGNTCGATAACTAYSDPMGAGACIPICSPLDDNTFRQSATKPGIACTAAQGCYGIPSGEPTSPTRFQCAPDTHITNRVVHRTQCTSANTCAGANNSPYLNGCSQGYVPLLQESTQITQIVCVAFCKPINCYQNNCGAGGVNAAGAAPHACNTTNAEGTFDTESATNNGDHCMYSWFFEIDNNNGNHVPSPTSNTVGICLNHKQYQYDTNADGTPDSNFPACSTLPLMGNTNPPYNAGDWGCVDTTTAGVMFTGKPKRPPIDLRFPYSLPIAP